MPEEDNSFLGVAGYIVIWSFVSIATIFAAMIFIGSMNNYGLSSLLSTTDQFIAFGIIPDNYDTIAENMAENLIKIIPYLDLLWFGGFATLVAGSIVFSYLARRENYFNMLTFAVLGIIIFMYLGGLVLEITSWFNQQVFSRVFPTFVNDFPLFNWYLDHLGIINLIVIVACFVANYIDLDLLKYTKRKEGEGFDEI